MNRLMRPSGATGEPMLHRPLARDAPVAQRNNTATRLVALRQLGVERGDRSWVCGRVT